MVVSNMNSQWKKEASDAIERLPDVPSEFSVKQEIFIHEGAFIEVNQMNSNIKDELLEDEVTNPSHLDNNSEMTHHINGTNQDEHLRVRHETPSQLRQRNPYHQVLHKMIVEAQFVSQQNEINDQNNLGHNLDPQLLHENHKWNTTGYVQHTLEAQIPNMTIHRKTTEQAQTKRILQNKARRLSRLQQTPEQLQERRKLEAQMRREARQRETPEQTQARRISQKETRRLARQRETPEQAQLRRMLDNEAHRLARQRETEEQAQTRRMLDSEAHRLARQRQTLEQAQARRMLDNEAHRLARQRETPEQTQIRRMLDNEAHRLTRQLQTPEQVQARRKSDNEAHHLARLRLSSNQSTQKLLNKIS